MTISKTTHPDYDEQLQYMTRADDVYNYRVKAKGQTYLPIMGSLPANAGTAKFNEYNAHKYNTTILPLAVFFNFVNHSVDGYIGAIQRKPPKIKFNESDDGSILDYLKTNADGKGNGLSQIARKTLLPQYMKGKAGYLVSVPEMGNLAEANAGIKVPRIVPFDASNIVDWDTEHVDGAEVLTMLLLSENSRGRVDGVLCDKERLIQYWLIDGGVTYEVSEDGETAMNGDKEMKGDLMKAGKKATSIPFHVVGALNNDWEQDPAPMRTQVDLNLLHYVMYNMDHSQRRDFPVAQIHVDMGSTNRAKKDFDELNPMGIMSSTAAPIITANGGNVQYLQPDESTLLSVAPNQILEDAARISAALYQNSSTETAKAAGMRASSQTATMSTIAQNNGDALENAIIDAAGYFGDIGNINTDEIMFSLNTEFIESSLDAQQLTAYSAMVMQGILPVRAMYDILRKSGDIAEDMTFQDYQDMLLEDKQGAMPDVSGTTNLPTDN